jgi:hypothetical protein
MRGPMPKLMSRYTRAEVRSASKPASSSETIWRRNPLARGSVVSCSSTRYRISLSRSSLVVSPLILLIGVLPAGRLRTDQRKVSIKVFESRLYSEDFFNRLFPGQATLSSLPGRNCDWSERQTTRSRSVAIVASDLVPYRACKFVACGWLVFARFFLLNRTAVGGHHAATTHQTDNPARRSFGRVGAAAPRASTGGSARPRARGAHQKGAANGNRCSHE